MYFFMEGILLVIVQKYCAMESAWKTETRFWDNPALNTTPVRNKRVHYRQAPGLNTKKQKPSIGHGTILEEWLNGPCKIHSTGGATPTHSLRACWILQQVARSGEELLTPESTEHHPRNTSTVWTVFETFAKQCAETNAPQPYRSLPGSNNKPMEWHGYYL